MASQARQLTSELFRCLGLSNGCALVKSKCGAAISSRLKGQVVLVVGDGVMGEVVIHWVRGVGGAVAQSPTQHPGCPPTAHRCRTAPESAPVSQPNSSDEPVNPNSSWNHLTNGYLSIRCCEHYNDVPWAPIQNGATALQLERSFKRSRIRVLLPLK